YVDILITGSVHAVVILYSSEPAKMTRGARLRPHTLQKLVLPFSFTLPIAISLHVPFSLSLTISLHCYQRLLSFAFKSLQGLLSFAFNGLMSIALPFKSLLSVLSLLGLLPFAFNSLLQLRPFPLQGLLQ
ncbi:MAG: hypothetical protein Q7U74_15275, partial [Saprospiraceae bacterium]|nr:hypothetical protein [Saprospiraceae bacterium]